MEPIRAVQVGTHQLPPRPLYIGHHTVRTTNGSRTNISTLHREDHLVPPPIPVYQDVARVPVTQSHSVWIPRPVETETTVMHEVPHTVAVRREHLETVPVDRTEMKRVDHTMLEPVAHTVAVPVERIVPTRVQDVEYQTHVDHVPRTTTTYEPQNVRSYEQQVVSTYEPETHYHQVPTTVRTTSVEPIPRTIQVTHW